MAYDELLSDPIVALGYGLLASRDNPLGTAMDMLSKSAERKRQQENDALEKRYKEAQLKEFDRKTEKDAFEKKMFSNLLGMPTEGGAAPAMAGGLDAADPEALQTIGLATGNNMLMALGNRRQASAEKKEADRIKALDAGTEKYSKAVTDSGIPDIIASVRQFNNSTTGVNDLPGYGASYSLPDAVISEEGRALRQTVAQLRNNILKARSGGAVTPSEADRFLQELGEGYFKDDNQLRRGVANIETALAQKLQNINAGYSPEVVGEYKKRGGNLDFGTVGAGPSVGAVEDGYRFKGGNPADPNSWEPVK